VHPKDALIALITRNFLFDAQRTDFVQSGMTYHNHQQIAIYVNAVEEILGVLRKQGSAFWA